MCQAGVGHRRAREDEHLQPRQAVEVLECLVGDFRVRKVDRVDGAAGAVFLELNLAAEALDLGNRLGLFFIQRRAAVLAGLARGLDARVPVWTGLFLFRLAGTTSQRNGEGARRRAVAGSAAYVGSWNYLGGT